MQDGGPTALVTGGSGFIGSHLVERLVRDGLHVRVLDDFSSGRLENLGRVEGRIELFKGSILDAELLAQAIVGCRFVFHLAAVVSVPLSLARPHYAHEVNATGTFAVIEAAKSAGCRVIFSSSAAVYGESRSAVQSEEGVPSPVSPYGVQKLLGEMYLRAYHRTHGLEALSLRYFNVYGPRQDAASPYSGVISIFTQRAANGEDLIIFGDGCQTRDYVHVEDVVEANVAAMNAVVADGSAINVGTGNATQLNTLAQAIVGTYGRGAIRYSEPRPGDVKDSCARTELAADSLGFRAAVELREGLETLVQART